MGDQWFNRALLISLAVGIIVCLIAIALRSWTATESLLLSMLLTVLSILASWLASRYYSEVSFNDRLRVFALKAAEKVNNLSNELDRLSVFLEQELKADDYPSNEQAMLARAIRIESAIHIIHTLKSVNDRSLSDWQGVIGDEINAQREEREELEEDLRELVDRVESLDSAHLEDLVSTQGENTAALQAEVEAIKGELRLLVSQVSGVPVRRAKVPATNRHTIELRCPKCEGAVRYRQRPKVGTSKAVRCSSCGVGLVSSFDGESFSLQVRRSVAERVNCPACTCDFVTDVDIMPGTASEATCPSCGVRVRVLRTQTGVSTKPGSAPLTDSAILNEEFIVRVKDLMPAQPWPKGITKTVAAGLGVPVGQVSRAIEELQRRGVFQVQFDGQLYVPDGRTPPADAVAPTPDAEAAKLTLQ